MVWPSPAYFRLVTRIAVWKSRLVRPLARRLMSRYRARRLPDLPVIGVTGSCGKTTTKNLIRLVLETRLHGVSSPSSRNGFGTSLRLLLRARPGDGFCLQEVGSHGPGTMAPILEVLRPTVGVVTTVGTDHYSAFRGPENVAREKGTLVEALPPGGWAVLNADDPFVEPMRHRTAAKVVTFGLSGAADVRAADIRCGWPDPITFTAHAGGESAAVVLPMYAPQMVPAALAALAVGRIFGIPLADGARALAAAQPQEGRLSSHPVPEGFTFLRDDWKASLQSLATTEDALRHARAPRKIVIVGTLSDYPGDAGRRYRRFAARLLDVADVVAFVGYNAHHVRRDRAAAGGRLHFFNTLPEADAWLTREVRPGDLVLLKGSSVDHLERLPYRRTMPIRCWIDDCKFKCPCPRCLWHRFQRRPRRFSASAAD